MSICRICSCEGNKHYPDCPFSNIKPKSNPLVPLRKIDYWLGTDDMRKQFKKEFEEGKYRYLGEGIFEEVTDAIHS